MAGKQNSPSLHSTSD